MGHDLLYRKSPRTCRTERRLAAVRGWGRRQWHVVAELAQSLTWVRRTGDGAQLYTCLGCILKKVNFTLHGFLSQKITLKNMIGAIGNIQFSFLQRFTFLLNYTHMCTTECGTSETRSVRCSGEVGVRDDQASQLHQQCAFLTTEPSLQYHSQFSMC